MSPIEHVLNLARWAPSGDNMQCWRFEVTGARSLRVHGFDTREHCVYDLDGHPSQISLGALFETMEIAASGQAWAMAMRRDPAATDEARPVFEVEFQEHPGLAPSPLLPWIERRCVQRRPFSLKALSATQKEALQAAVGPTYEVRWIEALSERLRFAKMLFHSAKLRLITPEAYPTHRDIIEWGARHSKDRIPDQALGASALTLAMMKFALKSWERVAFLNRYLAGTWAPRIELDFVPGVACAAHFVIVSRAGPLRSFEDYLAGGRAAQRFWLTAASLGLQLQPEITPLVFARYVREERRFSDNPASLALAPRIKQRLDSCLGEGVAQRAAFMGRVGLGPSPLARSGRLELAELMQQTPG